MGHINLGEPVTLHFGEECLSDLGDRASLSGRRVLVVTEKTYSQAGIADRVQDTIERRGLNCLVFDELIRSDPVVSINEALKVARGSHATALVGVGGVHTLMIARAVAAMAECSLDAESLFQGYEPQGMKGIPYFEIPASGGNPFLLRSESCLWDPYNGGAYSLLSLSSVLRGGVFLESGISSSMPHNYSLFKLLEQIMAASEGFLSRQGNFLSRNLLGSALGKVSPLLHRNHAHSWAPDWTAPRIEASVYSSLAHSLQPPGQIIIFAYSAADQWRIPRSSLAALLLPAFLETSYAQNSSHSEELENLLSPVDQTICLVFLGEELRSWMAEAGLPLRLRELQIKIEQLSASIERIKEHPLYVQGSHEMSSVDLFQLVKNSY